MFKTFVLSLKKTVLICLMHSLSDFTLTTVEEAKAIQLFSESVSQFAQILNVSSAALRVIVPRYEWYGILVDGCPVVVLHNNKQTSCLSNSILPFFIIMYKWQK